MAIRSDSELAAAIERVREAGTDLADIELKSGREGFPESARTMSAFSNTNGGTIVYGIPERTFAPVPNLDVKGLQNGCAQAARELVEPPIMADILELHYEGRPVVVANIPEASRRDKPVFVRKEGRTRGSYVRTGDGDHLLTIYELDRFVENQARVAFNDIEPVTRASEDDLDSVAVANWMRRIRTRAEGRTRTLSDRELLANHGILAHSPQGTHPTLAGLLTFGRMPQAFFPRLQILIVVYPTEVKSAATDSRRYSERIDVDGTIPEMIVSAVRGISRNIRHEGRIDGVLRDDIPQYPLVVLREAVANALIHRDYSADSWGAPVTVELYPSRIEISNPGGLFGPITIAELEESSATLSRNQYLAKILENVVLEDGQGQSGHVVENAGTGIPMIRNALSEAGLPPARMETSLNRFRIVFFGNGQHHLASSEQRIRSALMHGDLLTVAQLEGATSLSAQTIRKILDSLMDRGIAEGVGKPNSPRRAYRIANAL